MARKANNHNNQRVQNELEQVTLSILSSEARNVMRKVIQDAAYLGKNRVPEEDVYYIIRNTKELSEEAVLQSLKTYRQMRNMTYPQGKSSGEKYKRICTEVAKSFEVILDNGTEVHGLRKYADKKPLTNDQIIEVQALLATGVDAQSVIDLLITMK
ncbi:PHD/YefM family antitoxin component YafN of YafNO toxin-antitoxin module [Pantoea eucalypti]